MAGHRFNPEKAGKLVSSERYEKLPPDEIMADFHIEEGDIVADLGSGNGFFTIPFAKKTGETVYALDIEPKMLEMLKERAIDEGVTNIEYVESNLDEIKLEDSSVHHAFISFVLHEVPDIKRTLSEIKRILKPEGSVIAVEWEAIEEEAGPPLHHRISSENLKHIFEENGFEVIKNKHQNQSNYITAARPL